MCKGGRILMKCSHCKVEVLTTDNKCPLCQKPLTGKADAIFPKIDPDFKNHNLVFKIIAVIGLFCSGASLLVNVIFKTKVFFSIYVFLGFLYAIGFLYIAIKKRSNPSRAILSLVTITSIFVLLFDFVTSWRGWSITYVIPIVLAIAIMVMGIMCLASKLLIEDFLGYFLLNIIYGLIPIALVLTGIVKVIVPSFICIIISLFFFIFLLIFEGKNMRTELKRRLHV